MTVCNYVIDESKIPKIKMKNKYKDWDYHQKFYYYISMYDHTGNIDYIKCALGVKLELERVKPKSMFIPFLQKSLITYFNKFTENEIDTLLQ